MAALLCAQDGPTDHNVGLRSRPDWYAQVSTAFTRIQVSTQAISMLYKARNAAVSFVNLLATPESGPPSPFDLQYVVFYCCLLIIIDV